MAELPLDGSAAPRKLLDVPNGPGFPRVHGVAPDLNAWWFVDFANVQVADLATTQVTRAGPFLGAPSSVGFFQYVCSGC